MLAATTAPDISIHPKMLQETPTSHSATAMDFSNMSQPDYVLPKGVRAVSPEQLDLRLDAEVDHDLVNPPPVTSEKNIWFFWHSGFANMHHYTQRNIRAWHRRFSKQGWTVRVLDGHAGSPLNVANFLDIKDSNTFPKSFLDGTIGGDYAPQHTSDLVRFPLLVKYGGIYADVGLMQIGDVGALWDKTVGDPNSRFEVLSYSMDADKGRSLMNYFLCSGKNNPLFLRCHQLFLALWNEDGGKANTEGMHKSPLLKELPLMKSDLSFDEDGVHYGPEDVSVMLSDYITQGQVITAVMGLIDKEGGWNGPKYVAEHIYAPDYIEHSQLINIFTEWDGPRAFHLMSLPLPKDGEAESDEQRQAREIVEACLSRSFAFKLAHGLIIRVIGQTLGSLWRKNTDSDDVPGTYGHWLRYGIRNWTQETLPATMEFKETAPSKTGRLLEPNP